MLDIPRQLSEGAMPDLGQEWKLVLRPCMVRSGRVIPNGDRLSLTMKQATMKLAPSNGRDAKMNLVNARCGNYVGLLRTGKNFLLRNPTSDNDLGWLLKKQPELESMLSEIYLVEDVTIPRPAVDLPPIESRHAGAQR